MAFGCLLAARSCLSRFLLFYLRNLTSDLRPLSFLLPNRLGTEVTCYRSGNR
jgi:hypothetical protein